MAKAATMKTETARSGVFALLLLGVVFACASEPPPPNTLTFLDSQVFDDRLRASLASPLDAVTVTFTGTDVTVNAIPPRLDKWIYVVATSDGSVEAVPDPELVVERSMAGVAIALALSSYKLVAEYVAYAPVRDFDAHIYYAPKSALVTRVVFTRRAEGEGS